MRTGLASPSPPFAEDGPNFNNKMHDKCCGYAAHFYTKCLYLRRTVCGAFPSIEMEARLSQVPSPKSMTAI